MRPVEVSGPKPPVGLMNNWGIIVRGISHRRLSGEIMNQSGSLIRLKVVEMYA